MSKRRWHTRLFRIVVVAALIGSVGGAVVYVLRHEIMRRVEGLPAFTHEPGREWRTTVMVADGVELSTEIHLPEGEGPWPTVLIRNPYARFGVMVRSWCGRLMRYGYGCVYQDVRGQGDSGGDWEPLVNEGPDGSATLHWLADQEFQNGNLAMIGPSYLAAVQWAAAMDLPPEVKTLVPSVATTNSRDALYQNGMFRHETFTAWAVLMPKRGMPDSWAGEKYKNAIHHRPHVEIDERYLGRSLPWYREWVTSPHGSAKLWNRPEAKRLAAAPASLEIPILMVGGWYDIFLGPQIGDWQALASRSASRFVIGPWTHLGMGSAAIDAPDSGGGLLQWNLTLDWIGHHLRGESLENRPGIATYVIGGGRWIERDDWPPPGERQRLHMALPDSTEACATGGLVDSAATEERQARYRYDPADPVPSVGGAGMLAFILPGFDGAPPGNQWQPAPCSRADVLSFESEPLEAPLWIAGSIEVSLSVASDAPDTSFTAKLMEVLPDGRAVNIRDGITSLAYRNGSKDPLLYRPGETVDVAIELWPIEWQLSPGSRLRVDISSSDFPKFHAHPNRAGVWSEQADIAVAQQTLFTGGGRESWLELPVVAALP